MGSPGHNTDDDVFAAVTAKHPSINRATISRTLAWRKGRGLVCVTDRGGGAVEYRYLDERRHHHLICLT